jgi:hypothetical protein
VRFSESLQAMRVEVTSAAVAESEPQPGGVAAPAVAGEGDASA